MQSDLLAAVGDLHASEQFPPGHWPLILTF
jgi:hypothetical protein